MAATAWFEQFRAGLTAEQRDELENELAEKAEVILEEAVVAVRAAIEAADAEAKNRPESDKPTG